MDTNNPDMLAQERCEDCHAGAAGVSDTEITTLLEALPGWSLEYIDDIPQLCCSYVFDDFVSALNFTCRVGEMAENAGHHPAITTEWGKVTVRWWTHKINGLHRNDFIMAARTDRLPR